MKIRSKVWLLRGLLLVFSMALALVAAEVILGRGRGGAPVRRAESVGFMDQDRLLGWSLVPGARGRLQCPEFDVAVRINGHGFRADREYSREPPPGTRRIVAVGDSFTLGNGVEVFEAYPAIIERRLPTTEVINLGVAGYGVDQQLLMLESRGLRYRPDVVVLGLHIPDVFRNTASFHNGYGKPRFRLGPEGSLRLTNVPVPPLGTPPPHPRGLERSRLYRAVSTQLERRGFGEVWPLTDAILGRMKDTAAGADARLIVLLLPPQYAVYGSAFEKRSQAHTLENVAEILRERNIEHLDLTPTLAARAAENPDEPLFFPVDGHFTPAGHRAVAEGLIGALQRPQPP
jgi:lysophospholipase L1-like esterase